MGKRFSTDPARHQEIYWIERVTKLMDSRFRVPGTRIRFGLDPLLGLFPFFGEIISFAISSGLILSMIRHGASRKVVVLMIGNVALDLAVGSIPILGDIFDLTFKANQRNLRLLREHQLEGKHQGSGKGLLIGAAVALLLLFALFFFLLWQLLQATIALF